MIRQITALSFLAFALTACGQSTAEPEDRVTSLTGDIRLHEDFPSQFLGARHVIVYLPPGYEEEPERRYPVLYFHDGQNLFDGVTSFLPNKEWEVDETAEHLISAGEIEPVIIVGIYNAGEERANEYLPTRVTQRHGGTKHEFGGKADVYGRLIIEELMPFINANYRTHAGPEHTGLGGSSFGGIATAYLGLRHPEVFGNLLIVSPSVWVDDELIVKLVQDQPFTGQKVWLDMGTREGRSAIPSVRRLRDAYLANGWTLGENLAYVEAKDAEHNEPAWAARVEPMLRFLYGTAQDR